MEPSTEGNFEIEDRDNWLKYLEKNGYVVIKNVATEQEIARAIDLLWDFVNALPENEVKREDPETWTMKHGWFFSAKNGIGNGYGFGQSAFAWHARLLPKVEQAFRAIWGDDKTMLVSFDGGNVFRPTSHNPDWTTYGGWWHVDQNAARPEGRGKVCVQGMVTFTAATPQTGGLCVIPGSHLEHDDFCHRHPSLGKIGMDFSDYLNVPSDDPILEAPLAQRLVCCDAGSLILWDSRTVHCNTPGITPSTQTSSNPPPQQEESEGDKNTGEKREQTNVGLARVVAYVCMTPREWATEEVLALRRNAYVNNISTSHWPHRYYPAGGTAQTFYLQRNEPLNCSAKQREVIGFANPPPFEEQLAGLIRRIGKALRIH